MPNDDDFDAFCREAYPKLVGALGHIVGDASAAEDLAQEALVRAHERWRHVAELRSPLGWTTHVGANLARSHLRKRRVSLRPYPRATDVAPAHARDPDSANVAAVRQAMQRLSVPQREAVVLRYMLGLSAVEAASVLGLTAEAVRARTKRGSDVLREELAEHHQAQPGGAT